METQFETDYNRIAKAIEFLRLNYKSQPTLAEAADHVHLSPFHFQRMFKNWAGVTPKQFLQFISVTRAKSILENEKATLFDTAHEIGLSGTGRLHDLFIKIEAMTPGEFKNGGINLSINYSFVESQFGTVLAASTFVGLCYMSFVDEGRDDAFTKLQNRFPNAVYNERLDDIQRNALTIFNQDWSRLAEIKLHLKATAFQIKVWEALLQVPVGKVITYSRLANIAENPLAFRAVGSAVGSNPVAFLIPCHRVIRSTGDLGEYHWGAGRKNMIIGWEAARSVTGIQP